MSDAACLHTTDCLCDECMAEAQSKIRSRMGRNSRHKGKSFQKAVASVLRKEFGLSEDDLFSCVGGSSKESDIRGSAEFQKRFPMRIEAKNSKTLSMPAWIEQASVDNHQLKSALPWVIVFKQNGSSQMYATLKFSELLKLVKRAQLPEDE